METLKKMSSILSVKQSNHRNIRPLKSSRNICIYALQQFSFVTYFTILSQLSPLWSRVPGYRSRGPRFDSRCYQIFWEVVGLERGPLSLMRIIEELFEWKSSGSGQENRINDRGDPLRWPHDTLYLQRLALTSPTSGSRLVGIIRLRTKGHGV
jgi:hypothetical protein